MMPFLPPPSAPSPPDRQALAELLVQLLHALQRHRGLSAGFLAGEQHFDLLRQDKALEVSRCLSELSAQHGTLLKHGYPSHIRPRHDEIDALRAHWVELCATQAEHPVEFSFAQHTGLISQILEWLSHCFVPPAQLTNRSARHLYDNLALRLPALSELLGQTRALGAWVAARGGCSPLIRVRLIMLLARAESLMGEAHHTHERHPASLQSQRVIRTVAHTIRTEMLANSGIRIPPPRYFELTTEAIDAVFAWIRDSMHTLKHIAAPA